MYFRVLYSTLLVFTAIICSSCAPTQTPSTHQKPIEDSDHLDKKNTPYFNQESAIDWQPCVQPKFTDWFLSYSQVDSLECATLEIPLVQAVDGTNKPTVVKLAISRLPATGNKIQKLGTLISISGGPGQSGLDVSPIDSAAYKKLSKHFDIIGYAPRGVYPTTPTVKCSTVQRQLYPEDVQKFVKGCWEYTPADLLAQLGADYAIDDIEAIRQALGEPKINLIGYSYGTKIAALYAEKYPEHLRAGVLDGVVNLNETDSQVSLNQAASLQQTFERFVSHCDQQERCYFSDTNTVEEAEAKIAKLYHYIENNDIYDYDAQRISPMNMSWVFYGLLMWPDQWPVFNELLFNIENKNFEYLKAHISDEKDNIDYATFTAISCADGAPDKVQKANYLDEVKRIIAVSTWDSYRKFTNDEMLDACYYWPLTGSDIPHAPKLSTAAPPLLLVAQTDDFATPYINAVAMQRYLKSTLLTRKGDGHTLALFNWSVCVDNEVVNYLINPNKVIKTKAVDDNIYCAK